MSLRPSTRRLPPRPPGTIKNVRGAAQLLEESASASDRELTRLICDESDRICALVDRMEVFSDQRPIERGPVNIHEVLERVRLVAQTGFARHVRFVEEYDPSLPPVHGNRDLLIQVFLNLVKNAAEAVPAQGGEIQITSAYQHGVRLAVAGSDARIHLPLVISISDNGEGIPEELGQHLFDPFVTTKHNGTGLGLALVAKVIGDHGGIIEFDSQPRRTVFRVCLPIVPRAYGAGEMNAPTILIADDDRAIRTVLSQALGRMGHDVRTTGKDATLWRWVSDGEGDLIITEW